MPVTRTFTIAANADDGSVYQVAATYPPSSAVGLWMVDQAWYAKRDWNTVNFQTEVGLLRWDTSTLPTAATVTAASLRVNVPDVSTWISVVDGLSWTAGWLNWSDPSLSYTATPDTNAISGLSVNSTFTASGYYTFSLANAAANVNLSGYTGLRFSLTKRAADAAPTGRNYLGLASFSNVSGADPPQLLVTYTLNPVPPDSLISSSGFTGSYTDAVTDDANWLIGV